MNIFKAIAYSLGAAIVASLLVLLLGGCWLGFNFAEWPEWEGRIIGIIGTVAGVVGAVIGLQMALITERRSVND